MADNQTTAAIWTHISGDYDDLIRRDLDRRKEVQEMSDKPTLPSAHSAVDWHVGLTEKGDAEVRIVLRSKDEARAWAAWCFDHCGTPDPVEVADHG